MPDPTKGTPPTIGEIEAAALAFATERGNDLKTTTIETRRNALAEIDTALSVVERCRAITAAPTPAPAAPAKE